MANSLRLNSICIVHNNIQKYCCVQFTAELRIECKGDSIKKPKQKYYDCFYHGSERLH